jgi:hypothetical protein
MSTDRLDELGIPRRAFLKRAAGAALIAPAIVSFGMDVIAEGPSVSAAPVQSQPNQCLPNQSFANQALFPGHPLWDILDTILLAVASQPGGKPAISTRAADRLAALAMQAAILAASGDSARASVVWSQFIARVERGHRLPPEIAAALIREAQRAQQELC